MAWKKLIAASLKISTLGRCQAGAMALKHAQMGNLRSLPSQPVPEDPGVLAWKVASQQHPKPSNRGIEGPRAVAP